MQCTFVFSESFTSLLLEHMSLHQLQHMWFLHDRAPPHFLLTVIQHPYQTLGEQWGGHRGPVGLLAVGTPKTVVYLALINDLRGIPISRECLSGD
jgi:hypothetical protein